MNPYIVFFGDRPSSLLKKLGGGGQLHFSVSPSTLGSLGIFGFLNFLGLGIGTKSKALTIIRYCVVSEFQISDPRFIEALIWIRKAMQVQMQVISTKYYVFGYKKKLYQILELNLIFELFMIL